MSVAPGVSEAGLISAALPEQSAAPDETACPLPDGEYIVDVDTDSSMFHLNEASEGKGTLTVKDGKMTVHISLPSKKIENLFYGMAEDAAKALLRHALEAEQPLGRAEHAVPRAPDQIGPARAVPRAAQDEDDELVSRGAQAALPVATERDVEIVAEP